MCVRPYVGNVIQKVFGGVAILGTKSLSLRVVSGEMVRKTPSVGCGELFFCGKRHFVLLRVVLDHQELSNEYLDAKCECSIN